MLAFAAFFDKNGGALSECFMLKNDIVDFSLPATGDQTFSLAGARDKYPAVYFHPKNKMPGMARPQGEWTNAESAGFHKNLNLKERHASILE